MSKEQRLYEAYLKLQSKEWIEDIIDWENFGMPGYEVSIKVNFKWGWLRVYINKDGCIEWY